MRLMIIILLISFVVQSNAVFGLESIDVLNTVTNTIKQIIKPDQLFKKISDAIISAINIDKILEKLKQMITFEDIWNKAKSLINFQEILNKAVKYIKQKPKQVLNFIINPLQAFYNNRSSACDAVCESWYNYLCFLVMDCQKKKQEFQDIMLLPLVILGAILVCCCGAYIFSTFSNCAQFLKCLVLPIKVIFQQFQKKYRNRHRKLQTDEEQQNKEELPQSGIYSRIMTFKNWVSRSLDGIKLKIFKKKNNTNKGNQDHEIQPPLTAYRLKS